MTGSLRGDCEGQPSAKVFAEVKHVLQEDRHPSPALAAAAASYESYSIYALLGRKTGFVLYLIVANQTVVNTGQGYNLRTVELKLDRQQCGAPHCCTPAPSACMTLTSDVQRQTCV